MLVRVIFTFSSVNEAVPIGNDQPWCSLISRYTAPMATSIQLTPFCLSAWQTNCYVVSVGLQAWLVDVGFQPGPMLEHVQQNGLTVEAIVLTHAHVDHIAGLAEVHEALNQPTIMVHQQESAFLTDPSLNLSAMLDQQIVAPAANTLLEHGQVLTLGDQSFEVRHTPGHSPGGICLVNEDQGICLCGDAVFAGSIGRYDFPTSDGPTLIKSIREQILTLPDDMTLYPGHGPSTTVGQERASNPYLQ